MMKISYRLASLMIALLLTMMPALSLADREIVFTHEFDQAEGDYALNICSDGEGGFYALSQDKLMRWRPGYEQMDVIGLNELYFNGLACRGDEVYSMSRSQGLYKFEDGEWRGLGVPGWFNPEESRAEAGANKHTGNVVLGKDRVFFYSVDADQEMYYLSTYHMDSGEFTVEPKAVFSKYLFAYDEADDDIIGGVPNGKDRSALARYDYHTSSIVSMESETFAGEIADYDRARGRALFGSYWGAMLGLNDKDMMKIPGTPMKISTIALLDDGYMVYAVEQRDDKNARIVVLRYDPDRLEKVD
jgi:hypothetical protein